MTIENLKKQNLILFEVVSGSKAFGLDTPTSDTDIKGVFYMPQDKFLGLEYIPQIANETNDFVYYEIGRYIELLLKNNPNILEILASPEDCILYKHPIMENLKLENFLSKLCKETFAGYALTQIKKARGLKKKIVQPIEKERKTILDFCYIIEQYHTIDLKSWLIEHHYTQENCGLVNIPHAKGLYGLFYNHENKHGYKGIEHKENSNNVSISSIPNGEKLEAYLYFNLETYSSYCKEYKEYWEWVSKRNEDRFSTNLSHGKNYDSKNMMHTIRLLESAERILSTGTLNVRVPNREELLAIKKGEKNYDELISKADEIMEGIMSIASMSILPDEPNRDLALETLLAIRKELYLKN